ncbi:MAG: nitrilase [Pseudohongiellaceae bacterium]|jgi:nitrilase
MTAAANAPSPQADSLVVGVAQMAPLWFDRDGTLQKMEQWAERAADAGCGLVAFGEALAPGYPFWIERTDGARFESDRQKDLFARYLDQAVRPEQGHLAGLARVAARRGLHIVMGCVTAPADRGGHTLYCTLVHIGACGEVLTTHRKLVPTYEERLVWGQGDGHGLDVHAVGPFTVGGLNCWENWMPLARVALSAQGEDLHVAIWPGSLRNTEDITRFAAREGRSFVLAASGLLRPEDIPDDAPERAALINADGSALADGGSAIAGPDGQWVVEPVVGEEKLIVATLEAASVRRERQNFDPVGHYSRPDVTRLIVDRRRLGVMETID